MFTRNFWMVNAATFANKRSEVIGVYDSDTVKPSLITVSGSVGLDKYNSSSYKYDYVYYIPDGSGIHTYLQSVAQVDVSENITNTSNSDTMSRGVIFGSGNTPPTIDDYKLSGTPIQNITTSYTYSAQYAEDGSAAEVTYVYTITNNNDTEITIGEVGLFTESTWGTAYGKYTHHYYMFERTALETPITIPAGGVGQVTYTIRMNYPTA